MFISVLNHLWRPFFNYFFVNFVFIIVVTVFFLFGYRNCFVWICLFLIQSITVIFILLKWFLIPLASCSHPKNRSIEHQWHVVWTPTNFRWGMCLLNKFTIGHIEWVYLLKIKHWTIVKTMIWFSLSYFDDFTDKKNTRIWIIVCVNKLAYSQTINFLYF